MRDKTTGAETWWLRKSNGNRRRTAPPKARRDEYEKCVMLPPEVAAGLVKAMIGRWIDDPSSPEYITAEDVANLAN